MSQASWLIGGLLCGVVCAANAQAASPSAAASSTREAPPAASSARQDLASPLDRHVTLDLQNVTIATALDEIARQAHLDLSFSDEVVPSSRHVTIKVTNVTAREALKRVLRGTGTIVHESPNGSVLLFKDDKAAEKTEPNTSIVHGTGRVWGRVTDSATTQVIAGAVVSIEATSVTAVTNDSGFFLIQAPAGLRTLVVRHLGYAPAKREVAVVDSQLVRVDVALRMGMSRLQEVVTTATGQQRRLELANDITILDADSIVRTQPVSSVTQLLEGRVPGLTVEHTSGAPGDPSRLRLRGTSSMLKNNDPIVIVDGVRAYAKQSDSTSANLASGRGAGGNVLGGTLYTAAPSPLDQIDPQAIQTIEVLKGPSAATLYGPDAANGVIVITMKKGRAGPARWSVSAAHGLSYIPGQYPTGLYRFGTDQRTYTTVLCPLQSFTCTADSLVSFQALNDDRYTILKHGGNSSLSLGVSGGTDALTYSITGSYDNDQGLLSLPEIEASRFASIHGTAPDDWMSRPQQLRRWSGSSRLTAILGSKADASLTTTLTRETQQRSTLEQQISLLMATYIDPATGTYYRVNGQDLSSTPDLLPDFYQKSTDDATNFLNGITFNYRPRTWLTTSADAGINVINRQDDVLLPRGLAESDDSIGRLNTASGTTIQTTVNLRATGTAPLPWGFHLQLSTGANYTKTSDASITTGAIGLAPGTTSLNNAERIAFSNQLSTDITSFGWYIEPDFTHDRFTITTGLRIDGSSTFGSNVKVPLFPKVGVSWIISQEPWFPIKHFFDVLRVRGAYGRAGVWPGPTDQLRLYTSSRPWEDGGFVDITQVSQNSIGNSQIRPERSDEVEGGFDADFLDSRLSVGFSGYRKMRYDALESVPIAPSVYGSGIRQLENIGTVRNTGVEATLTAQLVRSDPITWSASINLTRNHNLVTMLGEGVTPFGSSDARIIAGYPLFSRWARPILGFSDADHNGIITRNEVLIGDTLVFMGGSDPNYESNLFTTLSLFRGTITISGSLAYQSGLTQINQTIGSGSQSIFSPGTSDPHSSLAEQAAIAALQETSYGVTQTVNTLRFNSFALAYNFSANAASMLGARALSIALEGTNLALHTNYRGKDPNVNAFATGNGTLDTGVLPIPRTWSLALHANY